MNAARVAGRGRQLLVLSRESLVVSQKQSLKNAQRFLRTKD